eukprot:CAMPEP_0196572978 /NCGR_PEP_ID=MMETSP1081-20130531/2946_1 /TAXON_ID=36882 /ORGANISM="Pyramimonas amylifera, Strain CCMP720" /LENGTH=144 /DNA_ID=CAMNT_0041890507 /DNA_START=25 /DNA_END=455 /DNA_ORIENTATION=+
MTTYLATVLPETPMPQMKAPPPSLPARLPTLPVSSLFTTTSRLSSSLAGFASQTKDLPKVKTGWRLLGEGDQEEGGGRSLRGGEEGGVGDGGGGDGGRGGLDGGGESKTDGGGGGGKVLSKQDYEDLSDFMMPLIKVACRAALA